MVLKLQPFTMVYGWAHGPCRVSHSLSLPSENKPLSKDTLSSPKEGVDVVAISFYLTGTLDAGRVLYLIYERRGLQRKLNQPSLLQRIHVS